jgi:restriction system protein
MGVPGSGVLLLCLLFGRPFPETLAWTVAAAFVGAVLLITGLYERQRGRNLIAEAHSVEDLRALTWRTFEELVQAGYRSRGWIVHPTNANSDADGGADMIITKRRKRLLVQAKQTRGLRTVGVDKVRELLGVITASKAHGGILVTCGSFSVEADRFAEANGIELVNGADLLRLIGHDATPVAIEAAGPKHSLVGPPCKRCSGPTHLVAKSLVASSYYGCDAYPECWCRIPLDRFEDIAAL